MEGTYCAYVHCLRERTMMEHYITKGVEPKSATWAESSSLQVTCLGVVGVGVGRAVVGGTVRYSGVPPGVPALPHGTLIIME